VDCIRNEEVPMTDLSNEVDKERDDEEWPAPGMHILIHNSWVQNEAGERVSPDDHYILSIGFPGGGDMGRTVMGQAHSRSAAMAMALEMAEEDADDGTPPLPITDFSTGPQDQPFVPTHIAVHWIDSGAPLSFVRLIDSHGTSIFAPGVASSHAEALLIASKASLRGADKRPLPVFDQTLRSRDEAPCAEEAQAPAMGLH
jgi:hypothetical protein